MLERIELLQCSINTNLAMMNFLVGLKQFELAKAYQRNLNKDREALKNLQFEWACDATQEIKLG